MFKYAEEFANITKIDLKYYSNDTSFHLFILGTDRKA